ncbi:hypothetical protein [Mucilaginibacter gynuensis]|uniref:hypothetical protein n=1 Tax=Mucilaginibacter gynuensis TaxID=1302236 RepID=UPI0031E8537F
MKQIQTMRLAAKANRIANSPGLRFAGPPSLLRKEGWMILQNKELRIPSFRLRREGIFAFLFPPLYGKAEEVLSLKANNI